MRLTLKLHVHRWIPLFLPDFLVKMYPFFKPSQANRNAKDQPPENQGIIS